MGERHGRDQLQFGASLFAQYVAGYVGNSVEHRGEHADQEAAWPVVELQELLDEWIVSVFTDRTPECPCRSPEPGCWAS